jgi:hypothetical protein
MAKDMLQRHPQKLQLLQQQQQQHPALLSAEGAFSQEKLRGALSSLVSGSLASGGTILGVSALGLSAPVSLVLFGFVLGSVLGYSFDIIFAKRDFGHPVSAHVPYAEIGTRFRWLVRSFAHRYFFRFVVTIVIETLTTLAMLGAVVRAMDAHGILTGWVLRDSVAAVLVAFANFWLFGNVLRFDWAYREEENQILNVVALLWMTLSMLVFAATWRSSDETNAASSLIPFKVLSTD